MTDANEVVFTRLIAAPRELVFKAFTDPKYLAQWWGPHGMTNPICEVDLRPGGAFRIVMRDPAGTDYPCAGNYLEIAEPERLAFTVAAVDHPEEWKNQLAQYQQGHPGEPALKQVWTVTLEAQAGKTLLTVRNRFESAEVLAAALKMGHREGAGQSIERLDAYITQLDVATREIRSTRVFDAPRDVVFKAWTDPKQIVRWWGPNGFTTTIHTMDVRPGGEWKFVMHGPDGVDYRNEIVYVEVVPTERLVYDHGPAPRFRTTVTFEAQGDKTLLTMQMLFATAAERDRTVDVFGAVEGNRQTLARLAEHLAQQ